jgi:ATP-binding cassette subfamily F protein 1
MLVSFTGTFFIAQVWIVDDGKITFYDGDFEDYREELIKEISAELDEED